MRRRARTRWLTAAVSVLVIVLATGCDPDEGRWVGPHKATDPGPRTAVMGDSLIDLHDDLWQRSKLAEEGPIAINSLSGTTYADHREWIRTLRPVPHRVIVALGTNNAWDVPPLDGWDDDDEEAFTRLIDTVLARGISCIVITTVGSEPTVRPIHKDHTRRANDFLRSFVAANDPETFRLADWQAASDGRAAYFVNDVHHSTAGVHAYYRLLADSARSCG